MAECSECGTILQTSSFGGGMTVLSGRSVVDFGDALLRQPRACKNCSMNFCTGCAMKAAAKFPGKGYYVCPNCGRKIGDADSQPSLIPESQVRTKTVEYSGCFIATACYGSYNCYEVIQLRKYRDNYLKKTRIGRILIKIYYKISPYLILLFLQSASQKKIIRNMFLAKIIKFVVYHMKESK